MSREKVLPPKSDAPFTQDKSGEFYAATAESIVKQTGVSKGFCLILAGGNGQLAMELTSARN